jgi:hypothetical protein
MKISNKLSPAQFWQRKRFATLGRVSGCSENLRLLTKDSDILTKSTKEKILTVVGLLNAIVKEIKLTPNPYK